MFPRNLIRNWAKHAQAWQARNSMGRRGLNSNRVTWHPARSISAAAAAGAGAAGGAVGFLARTAWNARLALGVAGGAAGTAAWKWRDDHDNVGPFDTQTLHGFSLRCCCCCWWCLQELAGQPGMKEMLVPGQMLRKHPVGQLLTEDDHLFETMRRSDQVKEFRCFYNTQTRKFYSVVMLGKDVCGYPSTVHGGLTAAIVDETFGGLYTALLTTGNLGATLPGLTARLELDYKKKISAGTVLLVTTELETIEPRKVWMKATVTDGGPSTFVQGRALFVAPNIGKQFAGLFKWKDGLAKQLQPGGYSQSSQ
ncbi:HotDog domain-containing protein [Scenedesmus sp. NREL 46B-D3]|nr:HotDog domain-containing protein [Scenedesmus sp. NREL 46B-D3]